MCLQFSFVYADMWWDCESVLSSSSVSDDWKYENILPKEAAQRSIWNIKKFCCSVDKNKNDLCSNVDQEWNYPSSTYIFDHIVDIMMRRLDAKIQNENGADLTYWIEPDEKWKEWREFITKEWNSKDGSVPLKIQNEWEKHWTVNKSFEIRSQQKDGIPPRTEDTFVDYNKRSLWEKYEWLCEAALFLTANNKLANISEDSYDMMYQAYLDCENMTKNRIYKEYEYTKAIIMNKGNKLLYNNVKSYLDNYFIQNKLISLQQLVFNIKNIFVEVNKAVSKLQPKCK